jgi:POT family proton-dependent oligopeptide transporter
MLAGLVVFVLGKKRAARRGEAPGALTKGTEWTLYGVGIAAVAVIWALIQYQDVIQTLLIVSGVGCSATCSTRRSSSSQACRATGSSRSCS